MTQKRKGSKLKTQGGRLADEIQRQKSIFKNLSWQVQQKDRKIGFLERYYSQLQAVIKKEKEDDIALVRRANGNRNKKKSGYIYRSHIMSQLAPSEQKRRFITEGHDNEEGRVSMGAVPIISEFYNRSEAKR